MRSADLTKSTLTLGPDRQVGKNTHKTIAEFETAARVKPHPDAILVNSIDEVLVLLGGTAGQLGDRKEFHYLIADKKPVPAPCRLEGIDPYKLHPLEVGPRTVNKRTLRDKRRLVLIKEAAVGGTV